MTRAEIEREIHKAVGVIPTGAEWLISRAISVTERLLRQETDRANAAEMNLEDYEACAAELFGLVCAVLDNKPEAAEARVKLQEHVEHVRSCRKGSCEVELRGDPRCAPQESRP